MTSKDDHFASSDSLRDDHCPMNNKIWTTVDVDLVNGSNTWLPAYGFQHHHNYFEPTHEESRINGLLFYISLYLCVVCILFLIWERKK